MTGPHRSFRTLAAAVGAAALSAAPAPLAAAAVVGRPAPAFELPDASGGTRSLEDYRGRYVVLEWINFDCPFVGKHYRSGHMQQLQKAYAAKGVAWLAVNSSAPGKQGNFPPAQILARSKQLGAAWDAYLVDEAGTVGRAYGAKTTPHMFVIDQSGTVVYAGGIDDTPSTDVADIATARNFVSAALDEVLLGRPVSVPTSTPYGCSVKYR